MVSQSRSARRRPSRDRLWAAAAAEFASHGFAGAKVDRIARLARVNKAMVYYHFPGKLALYRAILAEVFETLAVAVAAETERGGPPDDQLRRFIRAVAAQVGAVPHLSAIWLRELAEGGRHMDAATLQHVARVLGTLARVLAAGRATGAFRPVHPFVAQVSIVAPLLLFAAAAPARERFRQLAPELGAIDRESLVQHLEATTLAAVLAPAWPSTPVRPAGIGRRRSS